MSRRSWAASFASRLPIAVATMLLLAVVAAPGASSSPSLAMTSTYPPSSTAFASAINPLPTAVPLFVGQGTLSALGKSEGFSTALELTSYRDFSDLVAGPSPSLVAAITNFYELGGGNMQLQLTPDESPATVARALNSTASGVGYFTMVVVPSLGQLSGDGYQQVAIAANRRAHSADAMAILDPPNEVVAQVVAGGGDVTALTDFAQQLRAVVTSPAHTIVLSSGLLDEQDNPVSAAAAVAAEITVTDSLNGFWTSPSGAEHTFTGLHPVFEPTNASSTSLELSGVDGFRTIAGYGTVLWSSLTLLGLNGGSPGRYIQTQRVANQVTRMLPQLTAPFVFAPNNAQTWSAVQASVTSYLNGLWKAGALAGEARSDAYQVQVGLGTTMTNADITNGDMNVKVSISLTRPAEFTVLSASQQLGGSAKVTVPPTGVPLIVGQGSPTAAAKALPSFPGAIPMQDAADFAEFVADPSPSLLAGVQTFLNHGGGPFWIALTRDESATSLAQALASTTPGAGAIDLVVVPSLGQLSGNAYQQVAVAAARRANSALALAILDPPGDVVDQVAGDGDVTPLTALASQLQAAIADPGSAVLLSSGLLDAQNNPVSAAATFAGLIAAHDGQNGLWIAPGGLEQALSDVHPAWEPPNSSIDVLGAAGLVNFRTVAGYGTISMNGVTLRSHGAQGDPRLRYIGVQRLANQITVVLSQVDAGFASAANDAQTWAQVTGRMSSYLYGLWMQGAFGDPSAAQVYQVLVGLGTTMTAADVSKGDLKVQVRFTPTDGTVGDPAFLVINDQQQLAPSS